MIKRVVVAAFITAVTVGVAAPADAAPRHHGAAGSVSTQAIDWD
jgi:hypothetical protein